MVLILLFTAASIAIHASVSAIPTDSVIFVDGDSADLTAYNIDGNTYVRLRDLAALLSGSSKQFDIDWNVKNNEISISEGLKYTPIGGELSFPENSGKRKAALSDAKVKIDGKIVKLKSYSIDGSNYFELRDIAACLNFGVLWDSGAGKISIDTTSDYLQNEKNSELKVHFLDVGQGDSIFIQLPNGKTMLIDAGESEYGDSVTEYIKNQGCSRIDYLVATHPHSDHIGGMTKVIKSFSIGTLYMPDASTTTQTFEDFMKTVKKASINIITAKAGVSLFNSDGLSANIVAPTSSSYDDLNNFSAVIKLTYGSTSFLFMGDAEELSEKEITADVKADVLKVGHHGSSYSTGTAFLKKVSPKYAIISVGADNDYGHPAATTLKKLKTIGAMVYRTDQNGTVVISSDGANLGVELTKGSAA